MSSYFTDTALKPDITGHAVELRFYNINKRSLLFLETLLSTELRDEVGKCHVVNTHVTRDM